MRWSFCCTPTAVLPIRNCSSWPTPGVNRCYRTGCRRYGSSWVIPEPSVAAATKKPSQGRLFCAWPVLLTRAAAHGVEEVVIGFGLTQLIEQELDGLHIFHFRQQTTQNPQPLQRLFVVHHVFTTGAGTTDVDGRVNTLLGDLTIQMQFLVTSTFELFVNHFVHFGAGVHQRRGDDG